MSICFILSWNTGFAAICKEALLSQYSFTGNFISIPNSLNIPINQITSATIDAKLLYSAAVELLDTVGCFLDFQEIN